MLRAICRPAGSKPERSGKNVKKRIVVLLLLAAALSLISGASAENASANVGTRSYTLPEGFSVVGADRHQRYLDAVMILPDAVGGESEHQINIAIGDAQQHLLDEIGVTLEWIGEQLQSGGSNVSEAIEGRPTLYVQGRNAQRRLSVALIAVEIDGQIVVGYEALCPTDGAVGELLMEVMANAEPKKQEMTLTSGFGVSSTADVHPEESSVPEDDEETLPADGEEAQQAGIALSRPRDSVTIGQPQVIAAPEQSGQSTVSRPRHSVTVGQPQATAAPEQSGQSTVSRPRDSVTVGRPQATEAPGQSVRSYVERGADGIWRFCGIDWAMDAQSALEAIMQATGKEMEYNQEGVYVGISMQEFLMNGTTVPECFMPLCTFSVTEDVWQVECQLAPEAIRFESAEAAIDWYDSVARNALHLANTGATESERYCLYAGESFVDDLGWDEMLEAWLKAADHGAHDAVYGWVEDGNLRFSIEMDTIEGDRYITCWLVLEAPL